MRRARPRGTTLRRLFRRLIGGLSGVRLAKIHLKGPGTSARPGPDPSMADAVGKLVAALALTG